MNAWGAQGNMRLLLLVLLVCAAGASTADESCADQQGMQFVCGPVNAEDLLWLPDTQLIVASGMAHEGDAESAGHLYLFDPANRAYEEWFPGPAAVMRWDTSVFADCPGPLNTQHFSAHGLSVLAGESGVHRLYLTSHGEREAVEVFEVDTSGAAPSIAWVGCVLIPAGSSINSVAALGDGGFITTRISDFGADAGGDIMSGEISGFLYEWRPGGIIKRLVGTDMSGPNGIIVSADGRSVYVGSWGRAQVLRFVRDQDGQLRRDRSIATGFRVDNLRWTDAGTILATGHRLSDYTGCGAPVCFEEWEVAELNADLTQVSTLMVKPPTPGFVGATVALRDTAGGGYWMGTFVGDRLVYVRGE